MYQTASLLLFNIVIKEQIEKITRQVGGTCFIVKH